MSKFLSYIRINENKKKIYSRKIKLYFSIFNVALCSSKNIATHKTFMHNIIILHACKKDYFIEQIFCSVLVFLSVKKKKNT